MSTTRKDIVIVGGGGAGLMLARTLLSRLDPRKHSLTLINPRPFYVHLPRTVRMAVDGSGHSERRVLRSLYDEFRGVSPDFAKLKLGWVARLEGKAYKKGGYAVLSNEERVHYDILVLAPGMRLDDPLAYPDSMAGATAYIDQWRAKFKNAKHIVFGGGGPVSVEIAGEIKSLYPDKSVTIVQSRSLPFNSVYNDSFRKRALKVCQSIGIEFVLEDYLDATEPTNGTVTTRKGKILPADVVEVHLRRTLPAP
ncbi:unnamed protein product [Peniophora sp. CBMAI 1063]|nr:unnamed protein product [Peniophora sp. CBMAI 1063]